MKNRQALFDYFYQERNLTLLEGEIDEIIDMVNDFKETFGDDPSLTKYDNMPFKDLSGKYSDHNLSTSEQPVKNLDISVDLELEETVQCNYPIIIGSSVGVAMSENSYNRDLQQAAIFGANFQKERDGNKWISVNDKLPRHEQRVLILTDNNTVVTSLYNAHQNSFDRDTTDSTNEDRIYHFVWSKVEHWQPLPHSL